MAKLGGRARRPAPDGFSPGFQQLQQALAIQAVVHAELEKGLLAFLAHMADARRDIVHCMRDIALVHQDLAQIKATQAEHSRILAELPAAVRGRIGFLKPR